MAEQIKFSFDKTTLLKIVKGAGIAAGGALLTYLTQIITNADFGQYTPVIVGIWSIVVNAVREYIKGTNSIKREI